MPLVAVLAGEKNENPAEPDNHALGRSKGGFGTKLHILCDSKGRPLHFELSAGNTHESTMFGPVMDGADEALYSELGEAFAWPLALAGDKGYRACYKRRSIVECLIGWLKESRRIGTRFEKTAINFGGMVKLAFIHRYLRLCTSH